MSDDRDRGPLSDKDTPPWLQALPDDEEENTGGFLTGRKKLIASVALGTTAVALFVAVVMSLYKSADDSPARHIAAPQGDYREKPADPGGMEVPHQDKQVFEQADGNSVRDIVELGNQPEQPVESLPADEDVPTDMADTSVEQPPVDIASEPEPEAEAPKPEVKAEQKPAPKVEPKPEPKAETPAVVKPAAKASGFRIQLGAYGSEAGAAKAWKEIKGRYASLLGGFQSFYEPVKSGDRTLYRLRVGPMENRAQADQVCLGLRAQQQACIVVNP